MSITETQCFPLFIEKMQKKRQEIQREIAVGLLWLLSAILGFIAIPQTIELALRVYLYFWGDYVVYGSSYQGGSIIPQFFVLALSMPYIVAIVGGAEYHFRHFHTPRSWHFFTITFAVEVGLLLLATIL
ncbi:MAG: hypothetical protein K8R89_06925 [Anaerolineae bacterium]|nr:hypothetical protein [Anaerolineae bacterium]